MIMIQMIKEKRKKKKKKKQEVEEKEAEEEEEEEGRDWNEESQSIFALSETWILSFTKQFFCLFVCLFVFVFGLFSLYIFLTSNWIQKKLTKEKKFFFLKIELKNKKKPTNKKI